MYLTQPLHKALADFPDRVAVTYMGKQRTFREYGERVARLANALQALGMKEGDRVGMLALNSDIYLEYQMGVVWGGGVLNPCNIRWSPAEILYSLDDCETSILLVDKMFKAVVEAIRGNCKSLREVIYCGDDETPTGMHAYEKLLSAAKPVKDVGRQGDDLVGVFYTGGTTGFPKGVMLTHHNMTMVGLSAAADGTTKPSSVYLHSAPMFHLADFCGGLMQWFFGNTHAIIPMFTPEGFIQAIERDKVTTAVMVPTMIQMLLDHSILSKGHDLSSLNMILYGASPISEAILDRAIEAFPGVDFVQAYGMTENCALATRLPAWYHTVEGRKKNKLRSAGMTVNCSEIKIVNELGEELPRGEVGEIVIRGPSIMKGYWNKTNESAAALREGWYHSGDGGYIDDDGFIYIVDRLKDMIISGGENIYSAEVENAISQHSAVASCAVIGIPHVQWGEAVHAVVTLKPNQQISVKELIDYCHSLIAGYKCPKTVEFVETLPLSGAGKILKTKLREPYWAKQNCKVS
jgi:acyl-CoA synthetase (AMP-forming)/AMP-acid ligase II